MNKEKKARKIEKFERLVEKYSKKRECVKIYREVTQGEANIYGVILGKSDNFLHLIENNEFRFNGEIVIPSDHFDSIQCSPYEKKIKQILVSEQHLSKSKPKRTKVDLTNWATIFSDLMAKDIHVIVECEDLKKPTFTIGPIKRIKKNSVDILYYDPNGKLDKKTTNIKFKNITILRFKDRYSTIFRKYIKL